MNRRKVLTGKLSTSAVGSFIDAMSSLKISSEGDLKITLSDYDVEEFEWNISLSVHHKCIRELFYILMVGCRDRWGKNFFVEVIKNSEILKFNLDNYHLLPIDSEVLVTDLMWLDPVWTIVDNSDDVKNIIQHFNVAVGKKDIVLRRRD
ncbi:MAG: hypothetical protein ACKUBY_06125 [Candidatus Moraniibacteriota bacterium]|jgi:hypothetical protein